MHSSLVLSICFQLAGHSTLITNKTLLLLITSAAELNTINSNVFFMYIKSHTFRFPPCIYLNTIGLEADDLACVMFVLCTHKYVRCAQLGGGGGLHNAGRKRKKAPTSSRACFLQKLSRTELSRYHIYILTTREEAHEICCLHVYTYEPFCRGGVCCVFLIYIPICICICIYFGITPQKLCGVERARRRGSVRLYSTARTEEQLLWPKRIRRRLLRTGQTTTT